MKLVFTHEQHVVEYRGHYYNPKGVIGYQALRNYLHTFPDAFVVLRSQKADWIDASWLPVDGEGIQVWPIPEFGRLRALLKSGPRLIRALWQAVNEGDRYVVRMPGPTGALLALMLMLRGRHYGVELAGHYDQDLEDILAERNLGPQWIRGLINRVVAFVVRHAATTGYRSNYLRRVYPMFRRDRQWVFSGAQLSHEVIARPRAESEFKHSPFKIVSIGRIAVGKGYPLLVRVFNKVRQQADEAVEMEIIGDGDEVDKVRQEVERLSLQDAVSVRGRIPWGRQLFDRMNSAHLFVLPSESDGLPRSLVEAMARGMPALSTAVGGIPELLDPRDLVPPKDEDALVKKILPLIGNSKELAAMSRRNFEKSKEHWPEALDVAKRGFWRCVLQYAR